MSLELLLNTPRMYYRNYSGRNSVVGLYDLIKENVTPDMVIAEIGSFSGVSSELFAMHCTTLYCIDPWLPYPEIEKMYMDASEIFFDFMQKSYNNIIKMKLSSKEAVAHFEDNTLDLVYLDASHNYTSVKEDLQLWLPKIKVNGFIAGHDIIITDVKRAVDDVLGKNSCKIYSDTSWIHQT